MSHSRMQHHARRVIPTLLLAAFVLGAGAFRLAAQEPSPELQAILERIPVTPSEKQQVAWDLLSLGRDGLYQLCAMLGDEPLHEGATRALHGITHTVGQDGAEAERKMVAGVFAEVIVSDVSVGARTYLASELRLIGDEASVDALAALLDHPDLCEPGAQALVGIGGARAAAAIREALPGSKDGRRVTLVAAAGRLRDREAVPLLLNEAGHKDAAVRKAAVFALANIGDPRATDTLLKALNAPSEREHLRARENALLFARRLKENGERKAAVTVCRGLRTMTHPEDQRFQAAILYQLVQVADEKDVPGMLAEALESPNPVVRSLALDAAAETPGTAITKLLVDQLAVADADGRASLLDNLRDRGDAAALPAALDALTDSDQAVRLAAIGAVGNLGKRDAAEALIALLDEQGEEAGAAESALIAMGDPGLNETLVARLPEQAPDVAARLIRVVGTRDPESHLPLFLATAAGDTKQERIAALRVLGSMSNPDVVPRVMELAAREQDEGRQAQLKDCVISICRHIPASAHEATGQRLVSRYGKGPAFPRSVTLAALAYLAPGYPAGLEVIRDGLQDGDATVRDAAVRALIAWPGPDTLNDLQRIMKESDNTIHYVLAFRAYVKMIDTALADEDLRPPDAVDLYREAMSLARRKEEKREALGGISGVAHPAALELAVAALDDDSLQSEAASAAVRIGQAIRDEHKAETRAAMSRVLEVVKDKSVRKEAQELMR